MIFKLLKAIKYLCPLFAILIPVVAIFGAFISPPDWAESVLRNHDYRLKVLVVFSSKSGSYGYEEYQNSSRSYILFPSFKTVTVSRHSHKNQNDEVTSEVTSEESIIASYYAVLSYIAFLFGSWWYWIRPKSKQQTAKKEST